MCASSRFWILREFELGDIDQLLIFSGWSDSTNNGEDVWCLVGNIVHLFRIFRTLGVARNDIVWNAFQFFECKCHDSLHNTLAITSAVTAASHVFFVEIFLFDPLALGPRSK